MIENSKEAIEVNVEDIEEKVTVDVPEIERIEPKEDIENKEENIEVTDKVEKPIVPPTPKLPKEEVVNKPEKTKVNPIIGNEDVIKNGDEEENPNPPKYEETPTIEEELIENPVIVTPEVPTDTTNEKSENLVPDSENPFMQPPSNVPSNGNRGEVEGTKNSDYVPNTGDKF